MRKGRLEFLNSQSDNLGTSLEDVEKRIKALGEDSNNEKEEMRYLARLLSSGSILSLVEVLRKNQEIMNPETTSEKIANSELKVSVEVKDIHD